MKQNRIYSKIAIHLNGLFSNGIVESKDVSYNKHIYM